MAAAFAGGEIANRLGIINIPIEPVWEWAIELFTETRTAVQKASMIQEGSSYASAVNRYWNEFIHQILVVQSGQTDVDNALMNQSVSKPVIGALKGRHEVQTRRLYISVSDFVGWLNTKRMPTLQVMKGLTSSGTLIEELTTNLGEATANYSTAPVPCYLFDVDMLSKADDPIDTPL
jgi:hypothetical protein